MLNYDKEICKKCYEKNGQKNWSYDFKTEMAPPCFDMYEKVEDLEKRCPYKLEHLLKGEK
jgi:hypothetical protein